MAKRNLPEVVKLRHIITNIIKAYNVGIFEMASQNALSYDETIKYLKSKNLIADLLYEDILQPKEDDLIKIVSVIVNLTWDFNNSAIDFWKSQDYANPREAFISLRKYLTDRNRISYWLAETYF